ncbi:MAG: DUF2142 domain-containing protein [Acidobacteriota bacterium]
MPASPAVWWARAAFGLALFFGLLFAVVTPPSQAPDEPAHFRRAWGISEGRMFAERREDRVGAEVPTSVVDVSHDFLAGLPFHPERKIRPDAILAGFRIPLVASQREFIAFPNTALYGPVCYAPQAAAFALGRLFTRSVLALFYLGRVANVAAAAVLLALALRAVPFFRPVFFLAGLVPMAVFQAGSLSADGVTNGVAILLTAWILRCAFGEKARVEGSEVAWLLLLSVLLALTKPGYLLLSGLVLLVPSHRFGSRTRWAAIVTLVAVSAVGGAAMWAAAVNSRGLLGPPAAGPAASLRAAPAAFLLRMLADHLRRAPTLAAQFLGKLGWADVTIPVALLAAHGLVLLLTALTAGPTALRLRGRDRAILAAVVLGTVLIVAAPFYISVIPPGPEGASAHHPQGRYLLPLGPAALLLLCNRRWALDWEARRRALAGWVALVLAVSVASVAARYYL